MVPELEQRSVSAFRREAPAKNDDFLVPARSASENDDFFGGGFEGRSWYILDIF